jgi:mannan endo-1,4-beta-mannosidase
MTWSEFIEMSNPLDAVRAAYNDAHALSRDDPPMSQAMAAIRKASAAPDPQLVTPEPTPAAKELLAKLYRTAGQGILSGQDNDSNSATAATQQVFEITAKYPAIYGADLAAPGAPAVVDEATRQYRSHALVTLSWRPVRPTSDEPGKLSDFEWKELLTPGSRLFDRWSAQADAAAGYLKQLQDAGVPVLWRPYPQANGAKFWWAGRKAESAALYRQLFDRLVNHHKLRNLVWVWNAAAPGGPSGPGPDSPGQYADYFPGLEYADALAVDLGKMPFSWRRDAELARFAVGKTVGLVLEGWLPTPAMLEQPTRWAWFLASSTDQPDAMRELYANPRVISH